MVTRKDYDKLQEYYGEVPEFMKKYLNLRILARLNEDKELELTFTDSKAADLYINTNDSVNKRFSLPEDDVSHDLKLRKVNPLVNGRRYYSE